MSAIIETRKAASLLWGLACFIGATSLSLSAVAEGVYDLSGDTIQGNLKMPWYSESGNYFTSDTNGLPTSALPIDAVVGSGIEFVFASELSDTTVWRVTADVSGDQIAITETLSDPTPIYWEGSYTDWTLIISGLDWGGGAEIGAVTYITHNSHIGVQAYDPHSIEFALDRIVVHPVGGFSISRTTIVQFTAIPEPSSACLLLWGALVALWRKNRLAFRNPDIRHLRRTSSVQKVVA